MTTKGAYRVEGAPPPSERSCGFEACTGTVHSGYYCITHYGHLRTFGEMLPINYIRPGGRCAEQGCDLPHKARGLCKRHYERAQYRNEFPVRKCREADCEKRAKKRGMCATHYARARRAGEFIGPLCKVDGCQTFAARVGRCDRHAKRGLLYGLSDQEMARIDAGIPCEICGEASEVVDHCHASGRVRGYLCRTCNTAIGFMRDDPSIAAAASEYLERVIISVA